MFGIDGPELLVIIIVLIVVVGPKDLPKMMRALGKATARMRSTAQEFRRHFDDAMREAEMDDVADSLKNVGNLDPRKKLTEIFDPIRSVTNDLQNNVRMEKAAGQKKIATQQIENEPDENHMDELARTGNKIKTVAFDATDPALQTDVPDVIVSSSQKQKTEKKMAAPRTKAASVAKKIPAKNKGAGVKKSERISSGVVSKVTDNNVKASSIKSSKMLAKKARTSEVIKKTSAKG